MKNSFEIRNSFAAGAGPTSGVGAGFAARLATVQPARPCLARAPTSRRVGLPLRKGEVTLPQHGVDVLDGRVEVRSQRAARQHHLDVGGRWFGLWLPSGFGLGTGLHTGKVGTCLCRPLRALPDSKISRLISGCTCIVCGLGGIIGAVPLQGIAAIRARRTMR